MKSIGFGKTILPIVFRPIKNMQPILKTIIFLYNLLMTATLLFNIQKMAQQKSLMVRWHGARTVSMLSATILHCVKDSSIYYVLSSVPNTTRGQLRSYVYKQPGDPFTTYEMFIFSVQQKTSVKVNTPIIDFYQAPLLYWTKDNTKFYYEKNDRGHQRYRMIEVDVVNGNTKNIIDEQTKTFIYDDRIYLRYLQATDEFIWTSEKDGWQHIYLIDAINRETKK